MVKKGSEQRGNQMPERAQQLTTLPTLPHDVILEILYRTPVKDLIRFRCVSKSWLALTLDPTFIYMHLDRNKASVRFMFHGRTPDFTTNVMAFTDPTLTKVLFKVRSYEPNGLGYPTGFHFGNYTKDMVFCGSVNGIICLSYYRSSLNRSRWNDDAFQLERIILWNPAINCCKSILVPARNSTYDTSTRVSVGLGFDAHATDFKIVRIVGVNVQKSSTVMSRVEIFSDNQDCWEDVNDGALIPFCPVLQNCSFIVKGVPYWQVKGGLGVMNPCTGMYRRVPYPKYVANTRTWVNPVNLMDSVAVFIFSPGVEVNGLIDIYVLDDSCGSWMKRYTSGPIEFEKFWLPQCLVTGELVVQELLWTCVNVRPSIASSTYFYNSITYQLSHEFDAVKAYWYESYRHVDSLVCLKGMEPLHKEDKQKNWDKFLSKGFRFVQCFLPKSDTE